MKSTSTTTDGPVPHRRRKKTFAASSRALAVATASASATTTSVAGNKHARSSSRHRHESSAAVATAATTAPPPQSLHHSNNRNHVGQPMQDLSLRHSIDEPLSQPMEKGQTEPPPNSLSFNDDDCTAATTSTTTTKATGHTQNQRLTLLPVDCSLSEEQTTEDNATLPHQRKRQKRVRQRQHRNHNDDANSDYNTSDNSSSSYWQCQSCTLQNEARKRRCAVCGERRAVSTTTTMSTTSSAVNDTVANMSTDMEAHEAGAAAAAAASTTETLGRDNDDGRHSNGPTVERTIEPLDPNTTTTSGTTMDKTNVVAAAAAAPIADEQQNDAAMVASSSPQTASSWSLLCHPTGEAVENATTLTTEEAPPPPPTPRTMAHYDGDHAPPRPSRVNQTIADNDPQQQRPRSSRQGILPPHAQGAAATAAIAAATSETTGQPTSRSNAEEQQQLELRQQPNRSEATNAKRVETSMAHSSLEAAASPGIQHGHEIAADQSSPSPSWSTPHLAVLHQWLLQQNSVLQRQHETLQQLQQQTQELMNQTSSIAAWLLQVEQRQQQQLPKPDTNSPTTGSCIPLPSPLRALLPAQDDGSDAIAAAAAPSISTPPMHAAVARLLAPPTPENDIYGPDNGVARRHSHDHNRRVLPLVEAAAAPMAHPAPQLDLLTTTPAKEPKTKQRAPSTSETAPTTASSSTDASPSRSFSPDDSTLNSPKPLDNDNRAYAQTVATPADAAAATMALSDQTRRLAGSGGGLDHNTGGLNEAASSPLVSERNDVTMQNHGLGDDDPTSHGNNHSTGPRYSHQGLSPPKPPVADEQVDAAPMEQAVHTNGELKLPDAVDDEQQHNQNHDNENQLAQRAFPYETRANGFSKNSSPMSPPSPAGSTQTLEPDASPIRKHNARLFLDAERRALQRSADGAGLTVATNHVDGNSGVSNKRAMLSQKASKPLAASTNLKRAPTALTGGGWTSNTSSRQFLRQLDQAKHVALDNAAKAPTSEWLTTRRPPRPAIATNTRSAAAATTADDRLWSGNQDGEPGYAYQEVVRCKKERQNLPCHDCPQCRRFNEVLRNTGHYNEDDFAGNRNSTNPFGRHRARHARAETPVDFWELDFIDERDAALAAAAAAQAEAAARANDTELYE